MTSEACAKVVENRFRELIERFLTRVYKRKSIQDWVFTFQHCEKTIWKGDIMYMTGMAFDSINRDKMWQILEKCCMPKRSIDDIVLTIVPRLKAATGQYTESLLIHAVMNKIAKIMETRTSAAVVGHRNLQSVLVKSQCTPTTLLYLSQRWIHYNNF